MALDGPPGAGRPFFNRSTTTDLKTDPTRPIRAGSRFLGAIKEDPSDRKDDARRSKIDKSKGTSERSWITRSILFPRIFLPPPVLPPRGADTGIAQLEFSIREILL